MKFIGTYLLFYLSGLLLVTGFGAFLFGINIFLYPGPNWWSILIVVGFLVAFFGAITFWCVRNHIEEKKEHDLQMQKATGGTKTM